MTRTICHTIIVIALIAAFVLTGNALLLAGLFAYAGGAGVQAIPVKQ